MSQDINDIIGAIESVSRQNTLDIFVPTQNRTVKFRPMTVKHQKQIISSALENSLNTAHFHVECNNIISECCLEPDIEIYVIDRNAILVGLRVNMLGSIVPISDDKTYDIRDFYEQYSTLNPPEDLLNNITLEYNGIKIETKPPTVKIDGEVNKIAKKIFDKHLEEKKVKETVTEAIVFEILKYIHKIHAAGKTIEFDHSNALNLAPVVEALPLTLSKKLFDAIDHVKQYENSFTTVETDGEKQSIIIDARFFNGD